MDVYDFVQNGQNLVGGLVFLLSQQGIQEDEVCLLANRCLHLRMSVGSVGRGGREREGERGREREGERGEEKKEREREREKEREREGGRDGLISLRYM